LPINRKKIDDAESEIARFENARNMACAQLDGLYQDALIKAGKESATVFEIHKMMLEDLDFRESVTDIISTQFNNYRRDYKRTSKYGIINIIDIIRR